MASDKWVGTGGEAFQLDTTFDAARHAELCKYFLEPVPQDAGRSRACYASAHTCSHRTSVTHVYTGRVTWAPCVRIFVGRGGLGHQHETQRQSPNAVRLPGCSASMTERCCRAAGDGSASACASGAPRAMEMPSTAGQRESRDVGWKA